MRERPGVRLATLDIDEHPDIAEQLRVGMLPTLYLTHGGKIVDKLAGEQRQDKIIAFVAKAVGLNSSRGADELLIEASDLLSNGNHEEAKLIYFEVLEAARATHGALAMSGAALCSMAARDYEAASVLVQAIKKEFPGNMEDPIVKQACTAV